jgi:hypothetical protein
MALFLSYPPDSDIHQRERCLLLTPHAALISTELGCQADIHLLTSV